MFVRNADKAVFRGNFSSTKYMYQKRIMSQINDLSFYLIKLKNKQIKQKKGRGRLKNSDQNGANEIENGKAIEPINVINIESFREDHKIDTLTQPSQF